MKAAALNSQIVKTKVRPSSSCPSGSGLPLKHPGQVPTAAPCLLAQTASSRQAGLRAELLQTPPGQSSLFQPSTMVFQALIFIPAPSHSAAGGSSPLQGRRDVNQTHTPTAPQKQTYSLLFHPQATITHHRQRAQCNLTPHPLVPRCCVHHSRHRPAKAIVLSVYRTQAAWVPTSNCTFICYKHIYRFIQRKNRTSHVRILSFHVMQCLILGAASKSASVETERWPPHHSEPSRQRPEHQFHGKKPGSD